MILRHVVADRKLHIFYYTGVAYYDDNFHTTISEKPITRPVKWATANNFNGTEEERTAEIL